MNSKRLFWSFCMMVFSVTSMAQTSTLQKAVQQDTVKVNMLLQESKNLLADAPEQAINLSVQAKELSEKTGFLKGMAYALKNIGIGYYTQANYLEALNYWNQSLEVFRSMNDLVGIANMLNNIGAVHYNQGDDEKALDYYLKSLKVSEQAGDKLRILTAMNNIGSVYSRKPETHEKALHYYLMALPLAEQLNDKEAIGTTSVNIGEIYFEKGNDSLALVYLNKSLNALENSESLPYSYNAIGKVFQKKGLYNEALKYHSRALSIAERMNGKLNIVQSLMGLANTYISKGNDRSALNYYKRAEAIATEIKANYELKDIYRGMALAFARTAEFDKAFRYQYLYANVKDSLYNLETEKKLASLQFDFDLQKKQNEIDLLVKDRTLQHSELKRQRFAKNALLVGLVLIFFFAFILFRNFRTKVKINKKLDQQKARVERAYAELKATQAQLIQQEKMASLGEITAGISHEIQNPLNFVNNFSEVSVELMNEIEDEIKMGNNGEVLTLAGVVKQNLKKILEHGKRADIIIKAMQQHAMSSSAQKEPTDINDLANECLRLSMFSLKAKEKVFDTQVETHFDESIGKLNVVPQEMSRVLLNLYNNAFYSVIEKKKNKTDYQPTVSVSTKKVNDKILISVKDNGLGISPKAVGKIFQPFFTTKPTGEGTGLGLSLCYDIITKGHGGELQVKTEEGRYAEFTVSLPKSYSDMS
ncbi:MAG: tetratricopeptide repeat protein [Bacteroidota bacterium]|nr:tetratricopeptide repeat protein [Bacteroidota bacterium]